MNPEPPADDDPAAALLAQAMAGYQEDPAGGDFLIHCACIQATDPLPLQRIAYKFYNRQRRFDLALDFARRALQETARKAGLAGEFDTWTAASLGQVDPDLASQARLALKALAFLSLRAGAEDAARPYLDRLALLDPVDGSGASVVRALLESVEGNG